MSSYDDAADPIAIIGIGCRLPGGATTPAELWELLDTGVDAIGPVPVNRWDVDRYYSPKSQQPGRMNAREGGFLDEVDSFDAAFFGISARVAEQMDPQQRLLMETCWETFEDAGVVPGALAGDDVGVFMGACSQDYGGLQTAPSEIEGLGAHSATGTFMSILSNRLSYAFDFCGPSMTIDTACSSSLVAVHLACQSLRSGESTLALAGGVNVMLTPQFAIELSQAGMLSPDCRSRAFDAAADGYVRGEGVGVVLLKPLVAALLENDRVYGVIRGSSVNQDGRTQGITLPNGEAQEANFRAALAQARVDPAAVGYIEAHGTGTPAGDPIEAGALGRVVSKGRQPDERAYVGSIKTNVGHLEAGAGIAGLIKATLCVYHRRIPPSLHYHMPNPDIDFDRWRMRVPVASVSWPASYSRAIAAVNSFGFGGTNANVVLEEPPAGQEAVRSHTAARLAGEADPGVLTLSARNADALRRLADRYADRLAANAVDVVDLAACLARRRSHHPHRLAVVADSHEQAATRLLAYADGETPPGVTTGQVRGNRTGKVAFLFNGQGPQWHAMGRTLLETSRVFRDKIIECDRVAGHYLDWSLLGALTEDEASSRVHETQILQPTMFAIQVALAELWASWGVSPDGVAGHSMGEIAAAHVSGALNLDDALRVICHRSRIQEKADPSGGMMFVALPRDEAESLLLDHSGELWLSAENSAKAVTLSGRRPVLEKLAAELSERGVFARLLRVNCACHSPDMDTLREELLGALAGVDGAEAAIPLFSTVTGARMEGTEAGTEYWWRNFRRPVLFAPAVRSMIADGFDTFVELSPHPVLVNSVREVLDEAGGDAVVVSSLTRDTDDWECFQRAFATLYTTGRPVEWERRYPGTVPVFDLPVYPWTRERYWNESEASRHYRAGGQTHPMLKRIDAARPTWEIRWNDHRVTWVTEHDVFGSVIVPGAAYVEAALAAAAQLTGEPCALDFVEFERACVLGDELVVSRVELDQESGRFEVHSRGVRGDTWTRNAQGRFRRDVASVPAGAEFNLDAIRANCTATFDAIEVYRRMDDAGYAYGPSFCGINHVLVGEGEALARVEVPRLLSGRLDGYLFHPALLDACFQSAILHPGDPDAGQLLPYSYLPTGVEQVRMRSGASGPVWCYTRVHKLDAAELAVDIYVLDEQGRLIAEVTRLRGKAVRRLGAGEDEPLWQHLYRPMWRAVQPLRANPVTQTSAVTVSPDSLRSGAVAHPSDRPPGNDGYPAGYGDDMNDLCAAYILDCLLGFGQEIDVGVSFTLGDLTGLLPRFEPVLAGYLGFLVADGVLSERGVGYVVEHVPDAASEELWARAFMRYPACAWELLLVRATGTRLHEIMVGEVDPLEVLFPDGSREETEPIYDSSPISRAYNVTVRHAVEAVVRTADPRRTVRILEVGAGTGGLTAHVLPVLPPERCEYVFTDVSSAFLDGARERFRDYDFVDYRVLDLEQDPEEQHISPGSFDLVLAADVVHATPDIKRTLLNLRELLAPGGMLTLVEASPGNRWLELTFGLTEGWWSFRDVGLRPGGPLLSAADWETVLAAAGFDAVAALLGPGDGPGTQSVITASTPLPRQQATPPVGVGRRVGEAERPGDWLVIGEPGRLGGDLTWRIRDRGGRALLVRSTADAEPDGSSVRLGHCEDYDRVLAGLDPEGVVFLWQPGLDSGSDPVRHGRDQARCFIDVVRALHRKNPAKWPGLHIVTRGVHPFGDDDACLEGAPLWGLGLVAGLELPGPRPKLVDLAAQREPDDLEALWAELWVDDGEDEVALRSGQRFVRRITPVGQHEIEAPVDARALPEGRGLTLEVAAPGSLDELQYGPTERIEPGAGQVEVEVVAAGLNFLDVMTALGQVPRLESATAYRFGAECAGVVTRVGEGVAALGVGDRVVAVSTQGAMASHLTIDEHGVVAMPDALTFEEAASVPIAFLTASFTLRKLARLAEGERVLIHSATGGTGLAAIQVARLAGAEVFATAGTPEKRELLRAIGVSHVMDSRSLEFADEVLQATGGRGVDVVLNAIAGESAQRSLACLAPYGRFLEIGKRDLLGDRGLGLRPFLRNLAYFAFDLRQTLVARPAEVHAELEHLMKLFGEGRLRPPPHRVFRPSQTRSAFRRMAAGKHIGKLVLAMADPDVRVRLRQDTKPLDPEGTWLVTGGLGGVGTAMADALADAGVEQLVLIGRSGVPGEEAQARIDKLTARGVKVITDAVDVTSRDELAALLERIDRELPPLRGVLHCAMVLDDALLTELDAERLTRVLDPKALGAWHLHELTANRELTAFVLFSSATSLIGNRGQANYAAANAFLDHLAAARRARGLPSLAINLGAVSDAGYVARHADVARMVSATGLESFPAASAFAVVLALMNGAYPQVGAIPMDWRRFFGHHGFSSEMPPRYGEVASQRPAGGQDGPVPVGGNLSQRVSALTGGARTELIRSELAAKVSGVLGMPRDELDDDMPLMDYLDSLLAVEISAWLERELGAKVTIMDLMKGPSVAQLTEQLLPQVDKAA